LLLIIFYGNKRCISWNGDAVVLLIAANYCYN